MTKYEPQSTSEIDYQSIAEAIVRMAPIYRAPYVSIIGYSEALIDGLSGDLTETQVLDIDAIRISGWQALGNLNDILDVMLIISNEITYEHHLLEVDQLLKDVLRDVERTGFETKKLIKASIDTKATINGDEMRLRQAVLGLIGNALITEPKLPVYLQSQIEDDLVQINVRDGCKVASIDDLTYFFEPGWMSKLEDGRWRQMQWQSYLAHHFVNAVGGKIWVQKVETDGEMAAGTQVCFTLPITKEAQLSKPKEEESAKTE